MSESFKVFILKDHNPTSCLSLFYVQYSTIYTVFGRQTLHQQVPGDDLLVHKLMLGVRAAAQEAVYF